MPDLSPGMKRLRTAATDRLCLALGIDPADIEAIPPFDPWDVAKERDRQFAEWATREAERMAVEMTVQGHAEGWLPARAEIKHGVDDLY